MSLGVAPPPCQSARPLRQSTAETPLTRPQPRLDSGGSAGDGRRAESRRTSPDGGRDADHPALFLVGLNTCVPPFTAEADNCHIQRQRGGIGPAGARGPPGVQKPAPLATSRSSQRRGCGEGTNYNDSLMVGERQKGLWACQNVATARHYALTLLEVYLPNTWHKSSTS